MGGTSAFRLGMAAPKRFGAIGCLSSGNLWMNSLSNQVHAYAVKNIFGVERIEDIEGTKYDFFVDALRNIRENLPLPHIFHACGQQDHALPHAHSTAEWFKSNAPEYDYNYYEPNLGKHDDAFWCNRTNELMGIACSFHTVYKPYLRCLIFNSRKSFFIARCSYLNRHLKCPPLPNLLPLLI